MVGVLSRRVRTMAIEARRANVAGLARARTGIRLRRVVLPELRRVTGGRCSNELHSRPTSGTGRRHRVHHARLHADVATHAALPGVTRDAVGAGALRRSPMRPEKVGSTMTGRRWQRRRVWRRTVVHRERANHRRLGRIDVTRYAEVLRVTGGAARR